MFPLLSLPNSVEARIEAALRMAAGAEARGFTETAERTFNRALSIEAEYTTWRELF